MRTLILIAIGLLVGWLALRLSPAHWRTWIAVAFTAAWLSVCAWNLRTGLSHGYTLGEELPIHALLFSLPVAATWGLWLHFSRHAH